MGCKIAENKPLQLLRRSLGLAAQCHSLRTDCVRGHKSRTGDFTMGIPGAALGYCQALFARVGEADIHTQHVIDQLEMIEAPWARSHELFWGNRKDESAAEFVEKGIRPLLGSGRIPILISELDPENDKEIIESILETTPPVFSGETVLFRIVVSGKKSILETVNIVNSLIGKARKEREMPKWWPLFQGALNRDEWGFFKEILGENWKFVNVAVNPFTPNDVLDFLNEQITVAQIAVGLSEGITELGQITLAKGMVKLTGADSDTPSYSLPMYMKRLSHLETSPTLIVLGPSLLDWSAEINRNRLEKLKPHLYIACQVLWDKVKVADQEIVLKMSA